MKVTTSIRRVRTLLKGIRDATLEPQPDFQRRVVWSNDDKIRLLDTVLKGYPFPEIYVAAGGVDTMTGEGLELLVDGQQRITSLFQYFSGSEELKLGRKLVPYAQLTESQKLAFLEYEVVVRDLGSMENSEIIEVFRRINSTQYSLNTTEIQHAMYQGDFKDLAVALSDNSLFLENRIFSPSQIRRMLDVEFCLTVIATTMSTYFNRDTEIEKFLQRYNDEFEAMDEVKRDLEDVIDFIRQCNLPRNSRAWNRSDLFSLIVELHRAMFKDQNSSISPNVVGTRIETFFKEVLERNDFVETTYPGEILELYYQAAVQGTNDRGNRIRRGWILQQIIRGIPTNEMTIVQQHLYANPSKDVSQDSAAE